MKKLGIALVACTSMVGVAALIGVGKALSARSSESAGLIHRNHLPDVPSTEDKAIKYLIKTSDSAALFAERYSNWLIKKNGAESLADGIYLESLRRWGIYNSEDLLFESELYMALNNHRLSVIEAYGDIDIILNLIINNLYRIGSVYKEPYHCYDSITRAVVWERLLPTLKEMLSEARETQDFEVFESALQPYLATLGWYANDKYLSEVAEIKRILETEDVDNLTETEIQLYNLLNNNIERVKDILHNVENTYTA